MCAHHSMLDGMLEHLYWLLSKSHFSSYTINVQLNTALIKYNYFAYKYLYRCFCNIAHRCFFNFRHFMSLGLIFIKTTRFQLFFSFGYMKVTFTLCCKLFISIKFSMPLVYRFYWFSLFAARCSTSNP